MIWVVLTIWIVRSFGLWWGKCPPEPLWVAPDDGVKKERARVSACADSAPAPRIAGGKSGRPPYASTPSAHPLVRPRRPFPLPSPFGRGRGIRTWCLGSDLAWCLTGIAAWAWSVGAWTPVGMGVALLGQWEVWLGCALVAWNDRRATPLESWVCGTMLVVLWGMAVPSSEALLTSHILAPAHVWCARSAKVFFFFALCRAGLGKDAGRVVRACVVTSGWGILLGMAWAFGAPQWGNLWQWDFIETASLVFIGLMWAWMREPQRRCWPLMALSCWCIQWMSVYGLELAMSRHQYGAAGWEAVALGVAWMGMLTCMIARQKDAFPSPITFGDKIRVFVGFVAIFIVLLSMFGIQIDDFWMYIVFCALWMVFSYHRVKAGWGLGLALGMLGLAWLPQDADTTWAALDEGAYRLEGIEATASGGITDFRAHVVCAHEAGREGARAVVPFVAQNGQIMAGRGIDVWEGSRAVRLWIVDYRASRGVLLLVRDTSWAWLWLIVASMGAVWASWCVRPQTCRILQKPENAQPAQK